MQKQKATKKHYRQKDDDVILTDEKNSDIERWLDSVTPFAKSWTRPTITLENSFEMVDMKYVSTSGKQERVDSGLGSDIESGHIGRPAEGRSVKKKKSFLPEIRTEDVKQKIVANWRGSRFSRSTTYGLLKVPDLPRTAQIYRKVCRKLHILPVRRVMGQFGKSRIKLNDLCLSKAEVVATCKALHHETNAHHLDMSGNAMDKSETDLVLQLLSHNDIFTELRLADNRLSGAPMEAIQNHFRRHRNITMLDISGNRLTDRDGTHVAELIKMSPQLRVLHVHHNEFRVTAGKVIGKAIAETSNLVELDLSWNHVRQHGAIGVARGIQSNTSLRSINLGWNGFGYEGCVALSDALRQNMTLEKLDISCNRVHPPALIELMKGLLTNTTLKVLIMDRNPLTPSFASVLLEGIRNNQHAMALEVLSLQGVVVDRAFQGIFDSIQQQRSFNVQYETALPVSCKNRTDMLQEVQTRNNYNIEPLRMLYLLKEKNRAQDFFHKINKDHNDGLDTEELSQLFKDSGLPVSKYAVEKIMQFMDTDKDGKIDMGEFLVGDKKMKKLSRDYARSSVEDNINYTRYSRTFRKGHIQQLTSKLEVEETTQNYLSPIASVSASPTSSRRSSINYP